MKKILMLILVLLLCGCGAKVESIQMEKTVYKLGTDDKVVLEFSVLPEEAKKSSVKWISENPEVSIVKNGELIGIDEGTCVIVGKCDEVELITINVDVHDHQWENITRTVHHDEDGYFEAWDEVIIDSPAWDETIIDKPAWDESILIKEAYDETVLVKDAWDEVKVIKEAWTEKIIDQEYIAPTYVQKIYCNRCNRQHYNNQVGQKCTMPTCGGTVMMSSWTEGGQEEISHNVYHEAVTETIHHEAEYKNVHHEAEYKVIHHEAETHTVHHDEVSHVVHHEEIRDKSKFANGDKNHWIIIKAAYDEEVIIGYHCLICDQTKDDLDGLKYYAENTK